MLSEQQAERIIHALTRIVDIMECNAKGLPIDKPVVRPPVFVRNDDGSFSTYDVNKNEATGDAFFVKSKEPEEIKIVIPHLSEPMTHKVKTDSTVTVDNDPDKSIAF